MDNTIFFYLDFLFIYWFNNKRFRKHSFKTQCCLISLLQTNFYRQFCILRLNKNRRDLSCFEPTLTAFFPWQTRLLVLRFYSKHIHNKHRKAGFCINLCIFSWKWNSTEPIAACTRAWLTVACSNPHLTFHRRKSFDVGLLAHGLSRKPVGIINWSPCT